MNQIVSFAVQIIIPKFLADGEVRIAVMPYTKGYGTREAYTTTRVPVETGKTGETVLVTAMRGAGEEVAKNKTNFEVKVLGMAYAQLGTDQFDPKGLHAKIAMVMQHVHGELRNEGKQDDENADEFHGPMEWVEAKALLKNERLGAPKLIFAHALSITAFLRLMANRPEMKAVAERYHPILDLQGKCLTVEESTAVRALVNKK